MLFLNLAVLLLRYTTQEQTNSVKNVHNNTGNAKSGEGHKTIGSRHILVKFLM